MENTIFSLHKTRYQKGYIQASPFHIQPYFLHAPLLQRPLNVEREREHDPFNCHSLTIFVFVVVPSTLRQSQQIAQLNVGSRGKTGHGAGPLDAEGGDGARLRYDVVNVFHIALEFLRRKRGEEVGKAAGEGVGGAGGVDDGALVDRRRRNVNGNFGMSAEEDDARRADGDDHVFAPSFPQFFRHPLGVIHGFARRRSAR